MSSELQTGNVQDKGMALNASIGNACRAIPSVITPYGTEVRGSMVLSDIAELIMGQSPAGDACNTSGEGVPLLNGPTEFGSQHPKPVQYTIDVRKQANKGDLLFCVRGSTTGRMNWADQTYAIGRGLAAIRGKNGYPNSFVRAVIEYKLESLLVQATGSTFPNVGRDQLNGLEFPPVEKTAAIQISSILDPIYDRIALLRETNATLEAIAQALFKSWFVDFDPVHANAGTQAPSLPPEIQALFPATFTDSPKGPIPEGWSYVNLGELVCNQSTTFRFQGIDKVVFINTGDVSEGLFLHQDYVSTDGLPGQAKKAIQRDDILFSEIRPKNKRFAYVNLDPKDYVVSTKFMVLRAISDVSPRYIYQILKQDETIEFFNMIAESRSGTFPQITFDSIQTYQVLKPSKACVDKFIDLVSPIIEQIDLTSERQKELSILRDTLLPRLISGQLRLPEAEKAIAAITD